MRKFAILFGLAAVLTTGLMADKCTYAPSFPQEKHDDGKKQDK